MILVVLGILVLAGLYLMTTYNSFQVLKTRLEASIQEIGNQLKRQASLIPNLEASVKGYMKHEKSIFEELTAARKLIDTATKKTNGKNVEAVETQLNSILPKLQVIVESNPQIKASEVVTNLMDELRDTADKLMYARRAVIDITQNYNQMLVTFPSSLIANWFHFQKQPGLSTPQSGNFLSVSESETKDVKVSI